MEARLPLNILVAMKNIGDDDVDDLVIQATDGTAIPEDGISIAEVYIVAGYITKVLVNTEFGYEVHMGPSPFAPSTTAITGKVDPEQTPTPAKV